MFRLPSVNTPCFSNSRDREGACVHVWERANQCIQWITVLEWSIIVGSAVPDHLEVEQWEQVSPPTHPTAMRWPRALLNHSPHSNIIHCSICNTIDIAPSVPNRLPSFTQRAQRKHFIYPWKAANSGGGWMGSQVSRTAHTTLHNSRVGSHFGVGPPKQALPLTKSTMRSLTAKTSPLNTLPKKSLSLSAQ